MLKSTRACSLCKRSLTTLLSCHVTPQSAQPLPTILLERSRRQFSTSSVRQSSKDSFDDEYDWDPKNQADASFVKKCQPGEKSSTSLKKLKPLQLDLLNEALSHVPELGWTDETFVRAAEKLQISPSLMNSFDLSPEAALIFYFLDSKTMELENFLMEERQRHLDEFGRVKINDFVFTAVKHMIGYVIPYLKHWPEAISILFDPRNSMRLLSHHVEMCDLIWHYAGDTSLDFNWYSKRVLLSGVINSTQIHMLQDTSPDYELTWTFLHNRLKDVGAIGMGLNSLRKSVQSTSSLAEVALETARNIAGVPVTKR